MDKQDNKLDPKIWKKIKGKIERIRIYELGANWGSTAWNTDEYFDWIAISTT